MKKMTVIVALMSLATAACSAAQAETVEPDVAVQMTLPENPVVLPLRGYASAGDITIEQSRTMWTTIQECMAVKGFDYVKPTASAVTLLDTDRRYGVADHDDLTHDHGIEEDDSTHDHGIEEVVESGVNPARAALDSSEQSAWIGALSGSDRVRIDLVEGYVERSAGGCLEEGWASAVGDVDAWYELIFRVQDLSVYAYTLAETDPRVESALADWSLCMRDLGYVVSTPEDLGKVSGDDLAATSRLCNQQVGLSHTWLQVQAEVEAELMDASTVARLQELVDILEG